MARRRLDRKQGDLTEFLVHHRNKLTPADVGLPSSGRRRTPGLRREEVAALAGVGLTWYTWFEQGRDIQVSERFVLNVSRALKLDDAECCHLFLLAHRRAPPVAAYQEQTIAPRIQTLMNELLRPAYVMNLRWDIIAWNAAANDLLSLNKFDPSERNLLRIVFTDPEMRRRLPDWQQDASRLLAQFRCDLAVAPQDPVMQALIEDLSQLSPYFRQWWQTPNMEAYSRGIGSIVDTAGKQHQFSHETLTVDEHRHLRMVVWFDTDA